MKNDETLRTTPSNEIKKFDGFTSEASKTERRITESIQVLSSSHWYNQTNKRKLQNTTHSHACITDNGIHTIQSKKHVVQIIYNNIRLLTFYPTQNK